MNLNANESNSMTRFNYRDLMILVVPILIFFLYLFVYNPGILTVASYSQLHQIATSQFTSAHPILHTLLEKLFLKIFGNPLYIGAFQILIFSVMWMAICKYHRDDSAKSSNEFVVQFIITLIICLIPINAVYSITLSSYVLFSYSIMLLCFLIKIMVDRNGQIDTKLIVLMALTIGVMGGLNNYGIFIAIPIVIAIVYYLMEKNSSKNALVTFFGLAIICIFLIASLNLVFDVQKDGYNIQESDAFASGINLKDARNQFFSTTNTQASQEYESVTSVNEKQGSFNIIDSYVDAWRGNPILGMLFNNPILYMILSIILLALIYVRTDSNGILLVYLAPFVNTIIAIFTGRTNLYSNILVFYLIAIIFVGFYFRSNLKVGDFKNMVQTTSPPETKQIQPQFEVKEEYADDSYYSELESDIEDLTFEDINEMLVETPETEQSSPEGDSDLIDEILKEMEMEKKN